MFERASHHTVVLFGRTVRITFLCCRRRILISIDEITDFHPCGDRRCQDARLNSSMNRLLVATSILTAFVATAHATNCGTGGFSITGSAPVERIATAWVQSYLELCNDDTIVDISGGGSFAGAAGVCGTTTPEDPVDIGMMSRPWLKNEARLNDNGYTHDCLIGDTSRSAIQIAVAYDATAIFVKSGGVADQCIQTLGGGLSLDQLRYIFSTYTYNQLQTSGTWNDTSVPHPDPDDSSAKYWSELDGSCEHQLIFTVGPGSSTGINEVFVDSIGIERDQGENVVASIQWFVAPSSSDIVGYAKGDGNAIGYVENSFLSSTASSDLTVIALNSEGAFISPSFDTIQNKEYPLVNKVFMNPLDEVTSLLKTRPFLDYGFTADGTAEVESLDFVSLSSAEKAIMLDRITPRYISTACFPVNSMVDVLGKGPTPIQHILLGDRVRTRNGKFSKVYSFGHYDLEVKAEYLEITVEGGGAPLSISSDHMLFVGGKATPASTIIVGGAIDGVNGSTMAVTKITHTTATGAFAPFTMDGTIVVNDMVASSYISLQSDATHLMVGGVQTILGMHYLSHLSQAPHRVVCEVIPSFCQEETYINGISVWVAGSLDSAKWLLDQPVLVTLTLFVPAFTFCLGATVIETFYRMNLLLTFACITAFFAFRYTFSPVKSRT
eukprot:CAMPEP_0119008264 /NCGR_PEP_ID=MMETSP1176-20130426/3575_1 /TAXON_ID=265551 /ORGANISM="Synedropsis recta cf, Strain CCMP1620" /LENGTH=665 /DNA_ID=CAMNT_0006960567 /DNA_START=37 /DNA_END=2034 /DNA_ORIENTATION=+